MVSDIVLLKGLPDVIKNSVDAYIGCLSGAVMKDEYLEAISNTGFCDVRIMDETHFPVELMTNDPVAKALISDFNIPAEAIKEIGESIISIRVQGIK